MEGRVARNSLGGGLLPKVRLAGLILAVALLIAVPSPLLAQRVEERPNAEEARRAIDRLRSPYCPGFMLETCTSSQAAALRDSIYDLAAAGVPSDDIVEWMLERHGEEWRAVPRRSGPGLWAWVIPPLALLAGLAIILAWLRGSRDPDPVGPGLAESSAVTSEDREKLAAALREWRESGEEEL